MDKDYFLKLLQKYLAGSASVKEQVFVERYFDLFEGEQGVIETLNAEEKSVLKNTLKDDIWKNISVNEVIPARVRLINSTGFKIAAAAVLLAFIFISAVYFLKPSSGEAIPVAATKNVKPDLKKNRVIFLPDGSTVILNHGSKLNYPSTFDGLSTREVYLEGEAFFDIRHNKSRPFIVHTGKVETRVLGTAFNIKAVRGDDDITVTVKRGKVSVNKEGQLLGVLTPNQQITYVKSKVTSLTRTVDAEVVTSWKQEDLLIDNLTISESAKLIEDRYRVKIIINNAEVESLRFTTTFSKDETLEQTLNSICLFNELVYTYNKEKSTVHIHP